MRQYDSFMVTKNKRMKLIDFGFAERGNAGRDTGLQTYKERYSPLEQRLEEGKVGTYSDIYAFCATMYYCMTGTPPDSVTERMPVDKLDSPSALGADISPVQEAALLKGLAVEPDDRIQDAKDLYFFLYMYGQKEGKPDQLRQEIGRKKTEDLMEKVQANAKKQKQKRIYAVCVAITLLLVAGHLLLQNISTNRSDAEVSEWCWYESLIDDAPQKFYEAVNNSREYWGVDEPTVDANLVAMAEVFGDVLENASEKEVTTGWGPIYERGLIAVNERFDATGVTWMVIPRTSAAAAQTVLNEGLLATDNETRKSLRQCSRIGVVTVGNQDYLFYVVFMGE